MRFFKVCSALLIWLGSSLAMADEPVDKNFGGPYAGGQMVLGQGFKVGKGSPGPAYLLGFDLGYGMKRDTWNRIELGLELDTGKASFTDALPEGDLKVDLDIDLVMMVKAGYGYSLGSNAFGVFRAGAGIVQASYNGAKGVDGALPAALRL
ncbi:MAG: hypothetical protein NTX25_02045 [Proteobacteria bacterium]|nr:hypothetical protein [Pseudomonadota bacterium]